MYTARLPQINPQRPISKYRTYFYYDPKWKVLKMIIPKKVPPRAPKAKMPAFSILNARIDPQIPTKTLTIKAVQFSPFDEFYGITASHMMKETANPRRNPVMRRVALRNFNPKKQRNTPKVNIMTTLTHLLLLRKSHSEEKSIVGQPAEELTVRR